MAITRSIAGGELTLDVADQHWFDASPRVTRATYSHYVSVYYQGRSKRLARLIVDAPEGLVVDHINGNPLDNRRENLRLCTVKENNWNRRRRIGGSSRFKGVSRAGNRWKAIIWPNGSQKYLGSYADPEEAARAYDRAAAEEYGEFACLNFPGDGALRSAVLLSHADPNAETNRDNPHGR